MARDYMVAPKGGVKLAEIDPRDTDGVAKGDETTRKMTEDIVTLDQLQELLYVANDRAVLIILQGMDTSGKDGTLRHVFAGFGPAGCNVVDFKVPSELEAAHDYLWRVHAACPRKGNIAIFNRSHYESVLVERVLRLVPKKVWQQRYEQIKQFEAMLAAEGTLIYKFFLYISKDEQKRRLDERIATPDKQWKVNVGDWQNRQRWDDYMEAYEDALNRTSTTVAPWFVVPADRKWYRNYVVADILARRLSEYRDDWQQAIAQRGETNIKALQAAGVEQK